MPNMVDAAATVGDLADGGAGDVDVAVGGDVDGDDDVGNDDSGDVGLGLLFIFSRSAVTHFTFDGTVSGFTCMLGD